MASGQQRIPSATSITAWRTCHCPEPCIHSCEEPAGISNDDWSSRCGRLGGFGLVLPVPSNPNIQGPSVSCYRLTGRAVRLLGLLGRNTDPAAYPKALYNASGETKTVDDEDEQAALGAGWEETPAAFKDRG